MAQRPIDHLAAFRWTPQPQAAALVAGLVDALCQNCPPARRLARQLQRETGTRLVDWIDHFMWPVSEQLEEQLRASGFVVGKQEANTWHHPAGLFPRIRLRRGASPGAALRVESVSDFLRVHQHSGMAIEGRPLSPLRRARVHADSASELWVFERHGAAGFDPVEVTPDECRAAADHLQAFRTRRREFERDEEGFEHARELAQAAIDELGVDWASDLFFAAERDYWQSRNRAAKLQKARQDLLGVGWGNHDHHTYRSSRAQFHRLITLLELLGLECRERFYAGREAGWGAQVLEQPRSGIVVFADVALAPEELSEDFAHLPLPPRAELGTVGLWCALHGEAVLQAGMHHLEAQFDFDAARQQLGEAGVETMPPFTNFPYLKQCFTEGERWTVRQPRLDALLRERKISEQQAERFGQEGALGSHLEILERNDGYKGFNQTGVSEIIRATDPRNR